MVVSCPIADMLTRIRNANQMRYEEVSMPTSKIKQEIASILKSEGFINDFKVEKGDVQDTLVLTLKYGEKKERVISGLKCISKPGLRVYAKADNIPRVLNGLGIALHIGLVGSELGLVSSFLGHDHLQRQFGFSGKYCEMITSFIYF